MKRVILLALGGLFAFGLSPDMAFAQAAPAQAFIVATCGVLPSGTTYAQGQIRPRTQDANGELCEGGFGQSAMVVTSCGALPSGITYTVGQIKPMTQDANGEAC